MEIDVGATMADRLKLSQEDANYIDTIKMGEGMAQVDIHGINENVDPKCDDC